MRSWSAFRDCARYVCKCRWLGSICGYCDKAGFHTRSPEFFKGNDCTYPRHGKIGRISSLGRKHRVKKCLFCPVRKDPFRGSHSAQLCVGTLIFQIISREFKWKICYAAVVMTRLWNSYLCWIVFTLWLAAVKSVRDRLWLTLVCSRLPQLPGEPLEPHVWVAPHWCNEGFAIWPSVTQCAQIWAWHFSKQNVSENEVTTLGQISTAGLGDLIIMWGNVPLNRGGLNKNNFICIQVTFF